MENCGSRRIVCSFIVPDDMTFDDFEERVTIPDGVELDSFRVLDEDDPWDGYLNYLHDFFFTTDVTNHESPLLYSEWMLDQ